MTNRRIRWQEDRGGARLSALTPDGAMAEIALKDGQWHARIGVETRPFATKHEALAWCSHAADARAA